MDILEDFKISEPFQNILWGKYESVNNAYAGACAMPDSKQQRQKTKPNPFINNHATNSLNDRTI